MAVTLNAQGVLFVFSATRPNTQTSLLEFVLCSQRWTYASPLKMTTGLTQ
ncbi:hypothetical protein D791_02824 [Nitrincola nitratireducens]|uniref:Uncharacterized protein n=1 Tax=Nitrincola nitratireducens TaxID=1229521 RepID=W9UZY0_9GAMM|nr:hypothetical protein D791_02824 [Nitrincola nitratireducens]